MLFSILYLNDINKDKKQSIRKTSTLIRKSKKTKNTNKQQIYEKILNLTNNQKKDLKHQDAI